MPTEKKTRKKLIEVALPLEAINAEGSRRKRKAPAGYPTTLHKWWAQRPVAAARAVLFSQTVDDPSAWPDLFPTGKAQEKERQRLFRILEDLVQWEKTSDETVLGKAREEIWASWRRACAEHADHPQAKELFNRHELPSFYDPFAGSGAIPLEAQRLGLNSFAGDLNPVAVLINKAMIEIPPRFAGMPPAHASSSDQKSLVGREWKGTQGLAADVRYYGRQIQAEAERRIGDSYPSIEVTTAMAEERQDLTPYVRQSLRVIAWLWARTVKSPNPAFAGVDVPLVSTFMLSTKTGREAYVEPVIEDGGYEFRVKIGTPRNGAAVMEGTKLGRGANFRCLMSGTPISGEYIKAEGKAGRMGARLMAIVADGDRGRLYLSPTPEQEAAGRQAKPTWSPDGAVPARLTGGTCVPYGLSNWSDLFTDRQLVGLTTLSDLVVQTAAQVRRDALSAGFSDDDRALREGGAGARAYSEAVQVYLALALDRTVDYSSTIATWRPKDSAMRSSLAKQAIPMTWDYAEGSPFAESSAGFTPCVDVVAAVVEEALSTKNAGLAFQADAAGQSSYVTSAPVISLDPPYYDNIGYADLSDFFYAWLRRSARNVFPELFATLAVPKAEELVATRYRHGNKENAEAFFLEGMTQAMKRLSERAHPAFPVTIYYAFKQSEDETDAGVTSTGWETFLDAVIRAGFGISGTWPMRTEGDNRQVSIGANALASSIVLVCRPRLASAQAATRREFVAALKAELPVALAHLQRGNIAPVDLAQAAIGPGMSVYTRYSRVLDAEGKPLSVHDALALINHTLDESLAEQEGDFDADTRWAVAWFEQEGFAEGEFGAADVLARAKNTSVGGLVAAGILESKRGRVRLLKPSELPADWDPRSDERLTNWETVHHLIRVLEKGEAFAAALLVTLGSKAEMARELAYRLYAICERRKRSPEALAYNALVQSFPELTRLAREQLAAAAPAQTVMFAEAE